MASLSSLAYGVGMESDLPSAPQEAVSDLALLRGDNGREENDHNGQLLGGMTANEGRQEVIDV